MKFEDWPLIRKLNTSTDFSAATLYNILFDVEDPILWLHNYFNESNPTEFYHASLAYRVASVQPTNFVLYTARRFEIILNHFTRTLYDLSDNAPHFHHCNFATRLLTGRYIHVLYKNSGSVQTPDLAVDRVAIVSAGDGYLIDWNTYHTILEPLDGTLSLLIRGPKQDESLNISDEGYSVEAFLAEFEKMRLNIAETIEI